MLLLAYSRRGKKGGEVLKRATESAAPLYVLALIPRVFECIPLLGAAEGSFCKASILVWYADGVISGRVSLYASVS